MCFPEAFNHASFLPFLKIPSVNHRRNNWKLMSWMTTETNSNGFFQQIVCHSQQESCALLDVHATCVCAVIFHFLIEVLKIVGWISIKVIDYYSLPSELLRIALSKTKAIDAIHCCCNSLWWKNIKITHLHLILEAAVVWWLNLGYMRIPDLAFANAYRQLTRFSLSAHWNVEEFVTK